MPRSRRWSVMPPSVRVWCMDVVEVGQILGAEDFGWHVAASPACYPRLGREWR